MCYSAMIWADYRKYLKQTGSKLSMQGFLDAFGWRYDDGGLYAMRRVRVPKALELAWANPPASDPAQLEIKRLIDAYAMRQEAVWQQELLEQRARLAKAEARLAVKPDLKAALNDKRIAAGKIVQREAWIEDLHRTEPEPRDSRMFPASFVPVMVWENGQRTIRLMRYQCRPKGAPAAHDIKFPGTYNARRDKLEGFWRRQFGHSHAVIAVDRFYENVDRVRPDGKPYSTVIEFVPADGQTMFVACLWSHWSGPGEPDLDSFAIITDEPPPEVAAAGHDRCIVPIRPENIDRWLQPDPSRLDALYKILDDRPRPFYEHREAA